jgi:hypothetical protein
LRPIDKPIPTVDKHVGPTDKLIFRPTSTSDRLTSRFVRSTGTLPIRKPSRAVSCARLERNPGSLGLGMASNPANSGRKSVPLPCRGDAEATLAFLQMDDVGRVGSQARGVCGAMETKGYTVRRGDTL